MLQIFDTLPPKSLSYLLVMTTSLKLRVSFPHVFLYFSMYGSILKYYEVSFLCFLRFTQIISRYVSFNFLRCTPHDISGIYSCRYIYVILITIEYSTE